MSSDKGGWDDAERRDPAGTDAHAGPLSVSDVENWLRKEGLDEEEIAGKMSMMHDIGLLHKTEGFKFDKNDYMWNLKMLRLLPK